MPSSRRRPYRRTPEDEPQPRRSTSSRRRGSERRGVSSRERHELFSDPPEHSEGDELDSIGIEKKRRRSSRRGGSERRSARESEMDSAAGSAAMSKRERQNWARRKVRKLIPAGALLGLIGLGLIAWQIPGWIQGSFVDKLESSDAYTREYAAVNLAKDSAVSALAAKLESGKFEGSAGAAAVALAKIRFSDAGFEALVAATGSKKPETRAAAAYGLGMSGRKEAVEPLAKMLAGDENKVVRARAAEALGMIRSPKSVEALIGAAEGQSEVRAAALQSVLTAACPEAEEELVKGLGAPTREMREACRRALLALGAQVAEADLKKLLESTVPAVRAGAVSFMALGGNQKLFEEVAGKALDDQAPVVRTAAAEAAGLRRWKKSAEKLEKMVLGEQPAEVKTACVRALGRINRIESVVPLAKCLADSTQSQAVRVAAAETLAAMARRQKFRRPVGKYEEDERASHLAVAMTKPDIRWEAIKVLAAGCGSFKDEKLAAAGFEAMRQLSGRKKLAPKADVWKPWMEAKLKDARTLGQISKLVEQAYDLKSRKQETDAFKLMEQALKLSKGLLKRADQADTDFFHGLFKDLCRKIGRDPKKELDKPDAPDKKDEKKEEEKSEKKEDKPD